MRVFLLAVLLCLVGCDPTKPVEPGIEDAGTSGREDSGTTQPGGDAGLPPAADAGCTPEADEAFCRRWGKNCDRLTEVDNCGAVRVVTCGSCLAPDTCGGGGVANVCGRPACTPETDAALCSRLGAQCGQVEATDNCGTARTVSCGSCALPKTCGGGGSPNVCGCTPETNTAFCSRLGKNCGSITGTDNCGATRTVSSCGTCTSPQTCGGTGVANVCACKPETNATFCSRLGKNCGDVTGADNCGATRTVSSCGTCTSPLTCGGGGTPNTCGCTSAESDEALCQRYGKTCGYASLKDDCGTWRYVTCPGTCTAPETCGGGGTSNVCGCTPETDAAFCSARGANCGEVSGTDKCGNPRTVTCGTCASPRACGGSGTPNLCTLPLGDHPGVTMTKLSSDTPKAFFPSPNERHVAYSNTMTDSGWFGCEPRVGMGDLKVATPGATTVVQSIPGRIGFRETVFTKDSSVLVYTLYENSYPCTNFTTLRYTAADGTNSRYLDWDGYYQNIQAMGSSVFYIAKSYSSGDPGTASAVYQSGSSRYTTSLGYGSGRYAVEPSPDGSAVLFDDSNGVWTLRKLTSYSNTPLMVSPQKYLYGRAWSPDSSTLAFIHAAVAGEPRGLSLLSADGKTRRELTPDCGCTNVLFSPDGTRVAYDSADVDGKGRLVIQSLLGGEPVVLTGLPVTNGGKFMFSPDGRWVRVELGASGSYSYPLLFLADATRSGSFVQLASTYAYPNFTATPSWDHVAVMLEPQAYLYSAAVFPTAGGMAQEPVSEGVWWLGYPPAASEPKLAVLYRIQSSAESGTLALFNPDGSGLPLIVSTESWYYGTDWRIAKPFWAGQLLLHSVNRREDPTSGEKVFDLAAVSLDGTVSGLVARDVLQVSRLENPTRIFFTRSRQSGGGLWMVELPVTSP